MITLLEVRNSHLDLSRTAFPPVANGFVIHVTADVTHVSKELSCEGSMVKGKHLILLFTNSYKEFQGSGRGYWDAGAALSGWSKHHCSLQMFSEPGDLHRSV